MILRYLVYNEIENIMSGAETHTPATEWVTEWLYAASGSEVLIHLMKNLNSAEQKLGDICAWSYARTQKQLMFLKKELD